MNSQPRILRILADENIPFVEEAFAPLGTVQSLPGIQITPAAVQHADILLVRSVTRVDAALLRGSPVQFVGSATIGTDHVDQPWLREAGIVFAHAPGSNAGSVVEYVLAALLWLGVRQEQPLRGRTVGIVGCGHIGSRLAARLPALGLSVICCDPPLARQAEVRGMLHGFLPLETVLAEADIVTLHVPLTRQGDAPTWHLVEEAALQRMKPGAWLLNTARGAVVSNRALQSVLAAGALAAAVLDVWEGEPGPDPALIRRVQIATPHIAGYSFDGKVAGTRQVYHALLTFLGHPADFDFGSVLGPGPDDHLRLHPPDAALPETAWLDALVQQMYDLRADDARMRTLLEVPAPAHPELFHRLRRDFPRRRAFSRFRISVADVPAGLRQAVGEGLGVSLETTLESFKLSSI
jgi:erythronate-4-phosphate dehydrogenase